jgi:hypothetical protein
MAETTEEGVPEEEILRRAVASLNGHILGAVLGAVCGALLFLATLVLVLEGGPNTGATLWLLHHYFPGYTVTVAGAFVGFAYAFVVGYLAGYVVGKVYNRIVSLRAS